MAKTKGKSVNARIQPRAQDSLNKLIDWFAKNKPKYEGVIHVTLSDDTLRKFARKYTDASGNVVPGRWVYRDRVLHQHHDVKPRSS